LTAATFGNLNAISDAASAGQCAAAGFRSAVLNVRINAKNLNHPEKVADILAEVDQISHLPDALLARISEQLAARAGITL